MPLRKRCSCSAAPQSQPTRHRRRCAGPQPSMSAAVRHLLTTLTPSKHNLRPRVQRCSPSWPIVAAEAGSSLAAGPEAAGLASPAAPQPDGLLPSLERIAPSPGPAASTEPEAESAVSAAAEPPQRADAPAGAEQAAAPETTQPPMRLLVIDDEGVRPPCTRRSGCTQQRPSRALCAGLGAENEGSAFFLLSLLQHDSLCQISSHQCPFSRPLPCIPGQHPPHQSHPWAERCRCDQRI